MMIDGFAFPAVDQVPQLAIVCLDIRLACPDVLALNPKTAEIEGNLAFLAIAF